MVMQVVEFSSGGYKIEKILPKNQHTERQLLNFEIWCNGELSKQCLDLTFKVNFYWQDKQHNQVKSHWYKIPSDGIPIEPLVKKSEWWPPEEDNPWNLLFSTWMSKIIGIFLNFFFIEKYQFRSRFFVIDIFDNISVWITFFLR